MVYRSPIGECSDQHSPMHRWEERSVRPVTATASGDRRDQGCRRAGTHSSGRVQRARIRGPRGCCCWRGLNSPAPRPQGTLVSRDGQRPVLDAASHHRLLYRPAPLQSTGPSSWIGSRRRRPVPRLPRRRPRPCWLPSRRPRGCKGLRTCWFAERAMAGVGMSQWGAHGLAEQGVDFRSILRHYWEARRWFSRHRAIHPWHGCPHQGQSGTVDCLPRVELFPSA